MAASGRVPDPRKLVNTAVALGFVLLIAWALVLSKSDTPETVANSFEQTRIDSLRSALGRGTLEPARETGNASKTGTWTVLIGMAALLGGVYWYFSKKPASVAGKEPFPVKLEQQLAAGHRLMVLEAGPEYWVLSVSNSSVSMLARLNRVENAWLADMDTSSTGTNSFAAILRHMTGGAGS